MKNIWHSLLSILPPSNIIFNGHILRVMITVSAYPTIFANLGSHWKSCLLFWGINRSVTFLYKYLISYDNVYGQKLLFIINLSDLTYCRHIIFYKGKRKLFLFFYPVLHSNYAPFKSTEYLAP